MSETTKLSDENFAPGFGVHTETTRKLATDRLVDPDEDEQPSNHDDFLEGLLGIKES